MSNNTISTIATTAPSDAKRILLVEDEGDIRQLYAEVLRDAGYFIIEASDGEQALNKVTSEQWDMLLLDIMLPRVDGVTVLKKVKESDALKLKPIVLLTNLGSEHIIKECFSIGADGYLIKSEITPDKVVDEVNSFLNKGK